MLFRSGTDDGMLDWDAIERRLAGARNYWVATTRPDGRPHVMPVWGLWLDGGFAFCTDVASRKGRNLATRANVVVHLESGDDVVLLEGRAERLGQSAILERFVEDYDAKYAVKVDVSNPASGFYMVRPQLVQAWREQDFPSSATRWRFHG